MRIAYVSPEFVTETKGGGLATYINNIAHIMAGHGHKILVLVPSDHDEAINYDEGITVVRVKIDLENVDINVPGSIYLEKSIVINNKLLQIHKKNHIDLVQYSNWGGLAYFRTSIPTIVRISSDLPYWRAANKLSYDKNKKYVCNTATDYLEELSLLKADYVFGPSKLLANIIGERTGTNVEVIESPFDLKIVNEDKKIFERKLDKKKYVLTFGNMNLLKGTKTIGEMIYEFLSKNHDYVYVLAGNDNGWDDEEGKHISAVEFVRDSALEYKDRVVYVGALNREELYPIIRKAECIVLPSRIDNLPNACIEALALGKFVIGTHNSSIEQLIENGKNGLLVEKDNPKELCNAIVKGLSMKRVEKKGYEANAKLSVERLKSQYIGEKVEKLYNEIIKGKRKVLNQEYFQNILKKYNEIISR